MIKTCHLTKLLQPFVTLNHLLVHLTDVQKTQTMGRRVKKEHHWGQVWTGE